MCNIFQVVLDVDGGGDLVEAQLRSKIDVNGGGGDGYMCDDL